MKVERFQNECAGQLISRKNGVLYGYNAFGYKHVKGEKSCDSHYIQDIEEAATVREIFDLYLSGYGMKAICSRLIAEGRKNASGLVKFDTTTVSRILNNKLYAGYIVYNKSHKDDFLSKRVPNRDSSTYEYVKTDKVEPIVTEEEFEQVQEIINSRKKKNKGLGQCKRQAIDRYTKKLVCSCGKTYKRFKWRVLDDGTPIYGYQCRNIVENKSAEYRAKNGQASEGYCSLPSICQWKLDFMLEQIVREVWEKPSLTIKKLLQVVSDSYSECGENEENFKRVSALQAEIEKATARKQALEMKWLDGKLSDDDHDRLCSILDNNISTYQAEIDSINSLLEQLPDAEDIEEKLNNIRLMEQALIDNSNLTTLSLDDEFIDAFVTRIVPCEGRKFKWYINVGTGKSPGFFTEDSYELYDYFTLGFSTARSFRRA